MNAVILSEQVRKAEGLVNKVACAFEGPVKAEPKTLAEAVSNEIMGFMPRISPELFELTREVNVKLTEEQKNRIIDDYLDTYDTNVLWANRRNSDASLVCKGNILKFFYFSVNGPSEVTQKNSASVYLDKKFKIDNNYDSSGPSKPNSVISCEGYHLGQYENYHFSSKDKGFVSLDISVTWQSPFKLDVATKKPEVPESFISLGDEAIALYYDHLRKAPADLRKKTRLITPLLGILWSPSEDALYATGEIPEPKIQPIPKRDPALILDIPDGDIHYRHMVAAWNMDEEMPFRNWLREYSEGSLRDVKGMEE